MKKIMMIAIMMMAGFAIMPNVNAQVSVGSSDDLDTKINEALSSDGVINLTGDVTVSTTIRDIDASSKKLTINLGGHKIITSNQEKLFNIKKGEVEINGPGEIRNENSQSDAGTIYVYGSSSNDGSTTHLTIGAGVTISGIIPIVVSSTAGANYGATVDIYGTLRNDIFQNPNPDDPVDGSALSVFGEIKNGDVKINIHEGANLTSFVSNGVGIYQAGLSDITVTKATVSGRSGIVTKAGTLTLDHATVEADGEYKEPVSKGNGFNATGSAIQIETNGESYAGNINVNIDGGTFRSKYGYFIEEYAENGESKLQEINIEENPAVAVSSNDKYYSIEKDGIEETLPEPTEFKNPDATNVEQTPEEQQSEQKAEKNADTADINLGLLISLIVISTLGLGYTFKKRFN